MAAARRCGETGPTSRECRFLTAILPYDDVLRFRDDTRARSRARSGESLGIEAVALAVLVDT